MKKLVAVVVLGAAVVATAAVAGSGQRSQDQLDLTQVNAKIDARLHQLLAQQLAKHP